MPENDDLYTVTYYLPKRRVDSFPTEGDSTVADLFWQVYHRARSRTRQQAGEQLAVIIELDKFALGAFILPFQETQRMKETTVEAFAELLWTDWVEAFRYFPPACFHQLGDYLAKQPNE